MCPDKLNKYYDDKNQKSYQNRPMVSKQLGGLYMKPDMKIDQYETEKSHIVFWSSLYECLHVQKCYQIHNGLDFISVF